jgi:hypothetical protein
VAVAAGRGQVQLSLVPIRPHRGRAPSTPEIIWATGDGSPGEVTVTSNGGSEALLASGTDGVAPVPWLTADKAFVFRLYSTLTGHKLLARLSVGRSGSKSELTGLPSHAPTTSGFVNRVLQLLSFVGIAGLFLLGALQVRELVRRT